MDLPVFRNAAEIEPRPWYTGVSLNCAQVAREFRLIAAADSNQLSAGDGEQSLDVRAAHESETDDANAYGGGRWVVGGGLYFGHSSRKATIGSIRVAGYSGTKCGLGFPFDASIG